MLRKTVLAFLALTLLVLTLQVHCKYDKIKFFLTNYNVSNITDVDMRGNFKFFRITGAERSFQITAFGNKFIVDLTVHYQREDAIVSYISKLRNASDSFLASNYLLHYGAVRDVKDSFVLGFFAGENKLFRGYIITDEVYCVEPYGPSNLMIVYRFRDVIFPGCSKGPENEDLDCSETRYFTPWKANKPPSKRTSVSSYSLFYDTYLELYHSLMSKKDDQSQKKEHVGKTDEKKNTTRHGKNTTRSDKGKHSPGKVHKNMEKNKTKSNVYYYQNKDSEKDKSRDSSVKENQGKDKQNQKEENDDNENQGNKKGKHTPNKHGPGKVDKNMEKNKTKSNVYYYQNKDSEKYESRDSSLKENQGTDKQNQKEENDDSENQGKNKQTDKTDQKGKNYDKGEKGKNEQTSKTYQKEKHDKEKKGKKEPIGKTNQKEKSEDKERKEKKEQTSKTNQKGKNDDKDNKHELGGNTKSIIYPLAHGKNFSDSAKNTTKYSGKNETDESHGKGKGEEKHKPDHEDNKEEEEDDDDDDKNDDDDDNYEKDDDRFSVDNYVNYRVLSEDFDEGLQNATSGSTINGSLNIMNQFYNDAEYLDKWKESAYQSSESLNYEQVKSNEKSDNMRAPVAEALKKTVVEGRQCSVQVVIDPSISRKFGNSIEAALKDVFIQFSLANRILRKVPFTRKGSPFHPLLHVEEVVVHGDQVYSPFTEDGDLEYFTKVHRSTERFCLVVGLVNQYLRSGELYDGYIPESGGGACAKSGNILIISHGNENTPAPMGLYFAALMRGLTRALGADDKDPQCTEGTFPNPMQVLQEYILAKEVEPKTENSIFTTCNIEHIEEVVTYKDCFVKVPQPLCGNAVLDAEEECDCGPAYVCESVDPCCDAPHTGTDRNGCTLKPDAKCSSLQECCRGCAFDTLKTVCFSGSGPCDIATCDGKSASCPSGSEASEGLICSTYDEERPEPLVCQGGQCETPLCTGFGMEPCTCAPGTSRDCVYCCLKDGKCRATGSEVTIVEGRNYSLPDGTECMGGTCMSGKCTSVFELSVHNFTVLKRPRFPFEASGSTHLHQTLATLMGTLLSLLVLFLWQPERTVTWAPLRL